MGKELEGSLIERDEALYLQCGRCGWSHVHVCGVESENPEVLWHRVAMSVIREAAVAYREEAAKIAPVIGHRETLHWARDMLGDDSKLAAEVEKRMTEMIERRAAAQRIERRAARRAADAAEEDGDSQDPEPENAP